YQAAGTGELTSSGRSVSLNAWHHFEMSLAYSTHTYAVYGDGANLPVVNNEGFVDHSAAHPINDFTDAPIAAPATGPDAGSNNLTGHAYFDNYKVGLATVPVNTNGVALD